MTTAGDGLLKAPDIRAAQAPDADTIAALHATSWRRHYRGALSDAYLDGPVEAERLAVWRQRFERPANGQVVLVAERDGALLGFVCFFLDHDIHYGSLIDNLHVVREAHGQGVGRLLMRHAGQTMADASPGSPAYLYVLQQNRAAQQFYDRLGGTVAESRRLVEPDRSEVAVFRYVWSSVASLMA